MFYQKAAKLIWLFLVVVLIFSGCSVFKQQAMVEPDPVPLLSKPDPSLITNGRARQALDAAGGIGVWTQTASFRFDAVVTLYEPDGSSYLTEHHYEVYPWSNAIKISGREPKGQFSCLLRDGSFKFLKGSPASAGVVGRDMASAILSVTAGAARLADPNSHFVEQPNTIRVDGSMYQPLGLVEPPKKIEVTNEAGETLTKFITPSLRKVFYQNIDNSLVDMVWLSDADSNRYLLVRGFDYRKLNNGGILIPGKIELTATNSKGIRQRKLIEIDVE